MKVFLLFILNIEIASSQTIPSENKIKAVFLYNFTRFIDWPAESFRSAEAPFIIGVIGKDPFEEYLLQAVAGENVNGRPIVIEKYANLKEMKDCNMLYINLKSESSIKEILAALKDKKILTISEEEDFVKWGGIIRMYSDRNKIKLRINDSAARKSNIKISAKLLNVADVYYP